MCYTCKPWFFIYLFFNRDPKPAFKCSWHQGSPLLRNFGRRTAPLEETATTRSCTKPQIAQENHAHALLCLDPQSDIHAHLYTIIHGSSHLHTQGRDKPGSPDATTVVRSTISNKVKKERKKNSLVTVFPFFPACNVVHRFFSFTFRGITNSLGQVLHVYITTYSEYICISHNP